MELIYGIHAVEEALRARGRAFEYVAFARERKDARLQHLMDACRSAGVPVRLEPREQLNRMAKSSAHQGVVAVTAKKQYTDVEDVLVQRKGRFAFYLLLDGVEDPHNLGALLRTADAAGVDAVIIPERRAVGVNATVVKASAGAAEHVPVARVNNLGRAVEGFKSKNIWTVGLDQRGDQYYDQVDYRVDCALVLGAEGHGLHQHVRSKCDFVVSIPMTGKVDSLNVSVAGAIVMYEVARQRRTAQ